MLIVKSKYKIAKRLGASIFEKTQTQKFALSEARSKGKQRRGRGGSDFGRQLLEKQRVRYTFGISEKQLANYVKSAFTKDDPAKVLHKELETRADSVAYRAGFASTRRAARQAVSHGHFTINGKRITTPSYTLRKGDVLAVREGNRTSPLYAGLSEERAENTRTVPQWLAVDLNLLKAEVVGEPTYSPADSTLDYSTVFEFYSR